MNKIPIISVELINDFEQIIENTEKFGHIYKAVEICEYGIAKGNTFVSGLSLTIVSEGNWYDALEENISNWGDEFICHLPNEGLIKGAYYEAKEVCTSIDEFGNCDDTEIYIERVL